MKNVIATVSNYFLIEIASQKTSGSNESKIAPNRFTSKTKCAALLVNAVLFLFLSLFLTDAAARAASFTVNLNTDTSDVNVGNGVCDTNAATPGEQCTLRAAIQEANFFTGVDFITFSLPTPNIITLTNSELEIQYSVSIDGPGARNLTIQRSAGGNRKLRVLTVTGSNQNVTISGVTIANGNSEDDLVSGGIGGGILLASANLNLIGVNVSNNAAQQGAGIYIGFGTLNITRSLIGNNQAVTSGGGIYNNSGTLNITNSTIGNNTSGGTGFDAGGGICNINGTANLTNVTISNNAAHVGGGIRNNSGGTFNVRNTIIAGNTDNSGYADIVGTFASQGNNLIGVAGPGSGFTDGVNGDKTGFLGAPLDAQLGALQNNGGQTDTRALLPGSPAIDAGNNCVALIFPQGCSPTQLASDQRGAGFSRQVDGDGNGTAAVDIGAFEVQMAPTAANVVAGGRILTAEGESAKSKGIKNVRVMITFPNGETRETVSGAHGYYEFSDIPANETYVFVAFGKRYTFSPGVQVRTINEDTHDIDFVADQN